MGQLVSGFFGKLPSHGDFLRAAPAQAPLDLIDAWLAPAGLGQGPADLALDAAGPALAMVEARGMWWALALFPSRDAVGRRFPFCAIAGLPAAGFAGEVALVPQVFAPFLGRCMQHAASGWPAEVAALRDLVAGFGGAVDLDAAGLRLADTLADHHMRGLWQAMLGQGDDPRRAGVFTEVVAAALSGEACCGVRLRPMAQLHHLSFWLMLLRLSAPRGSAPSLIVIHPGTGGAQPMATVVWGRPGPAECLAAIWPALPGGAGARIHDPAASPARFGDAEVAPEILDDLDLSLREVLHSIGSQSRRYPNSQTSRTVQR